MQLEVFWILSKEVCIRDISYFSVEEDLLTISAAALPPSTVCWILLLLLHSALKWGKLSNNELSHKCERGNKITPLWHKCRAKWGKRAKRVQFYCPWSTYPAIVLLVLYFIVKTIKQFLIQVPSEVWHASKIAL